MVNAIVTLIVAALALALCIAVGLPALVGIIAAILIMLSGFPRGAHSSRARR
jgi:hypothetical protein